MKQAEDTIDKSTGSIEWKNQTITYEYQGDTEDLEGWRVYAICTYIVGRHHPYFEVAEMPDGITFSRIEDGVCRSESTSLVESGLALPFTDGSEIGVEVNFAAYHGELQ